MGKSPSRPPIGLKLARTARSVTQAFEQAMAAASGSMATWQVLLLVRSQQWGTQTQMAAALGITGATLTHHLNALEEQGLVRRWRESSNRRVQRVALTDAGKEMFERLRHVAAEHDQRLRSALSAEELAQLADLLDRLAAAVADVRTGEEASSTAGSPDRT